MSQRTLLIAALALMAGGLLLGSLGLVFGGGATPIRSQQVLGPQGQQGPQGGSRPLRPGFGLGPERGEGPRRGIPIPAASPRPSPRA